MDVLRTLLAAGSNLCSNNHGWLTSAVDTAACHGNLEIIKMLFTAGADANDGCMLQIAARYGQLEIVRYLLAAKVNVNAVDKLESTALIAAAKNGHSDIVKELLENGADPKINHNIGNSVRLSAIGTAIDAAAINGHVDIVKILTETHVNMDTDCGTPLTSAATFGHEDIVKILLQNSADVNKVTERGTALSAAAGNGHLDIVKLLVDHQADVNKDTAHGTVLASAVSNGHLAVVSFLIRNGADVNAESSRGPALRASVRYNASLKIIASLTNSGANVNAEDADSYTALDIAHLKSLNDHYKRLKQADGKEGTYLMRGVIRTPWGESAKALSARGVLITQANLNDVTSLTAAITGSYAIFAVTDFWGPFKELSQQQAVALETVQKISQDTPVYCLGDTRTNFGLFVRAILGDEKVRHSKVVFASLERITLGDILQKWAQARGVKAQYAQIDKQVYDALWPGLGGEFVRGMGFWA
ncbi:ankyrin repeat-containing domain protein [Xylaria telfairii]|nr:ankyrin repeat-containing domain protein [Xylaria telfairii]